MSNTTEAVDIGEKSKLRRDGEERGGRNYFSGAGRALRGAPGRAAPGARHAPHRRRGPGPRLPAAFVPRSGGLALIRLRRALIPGRGAARLQQPPGPRPCPAGPPPPSAPGRGAARQGRAGSWALARGGADLPRLCPGASLRPWGGQPRPRGRGDPSPPGHGAREVNRGLLPPPAAAAGDEGRGSRPAGSPAAVPSQRQQGTAGKLPPAGGSHQIASLLGAPLKPRTWSPKLLIAGAEKRGACGELDSSRQPSEWTARAESNTLRYCTLHKQQPCC
ncbi:uncharacterized protein LOC141729245 [Zonotrichia albicollis]|uniref:uncharacterized protein LOC141729245 n=1 Tax=Zonotrichia albicollis TaxID=44394 RepID=UPI003D8108FC